MCTYVREVDRVDTAFDLRPTDFLNLSFINVCFIERKLDQECVDLIFEKSSNESKKRDIVYTLDLSTAQDYIFYAPKKTKYDVSMAHCVFSFWQFEVN